MKIKNLTEEGLKGFRVCSVTSQVAYPNCVDVLGPSSPAEESDAGQHPRRFIALGEDLADQPYPPQKQHQTEHGYDGREELEKGRGFEREEA